jgi:hypothetical protein
LWTICPVWLWTVLLISASWVARIIGMSHWRPPGNNSCILKRGMDFSLLLANVNIFHSVNIHYCQMYPRTLLNFSLVFFQDKT